LGRDRLSDTRQAAQLVMCSVSFDLDSVTVRRRVAGLPGIEHVSFQVTLPKRVQVQGVSGWYTLTIAKRKRS